MIILKQYINKANQKASLLTVRRFIRNYIYPNKLPIISLDELHKFPSTEQNLNKQHEITSDASITAKNKQYVQINTVWIPQNTDILK